MDVLGAFLSIAILVGIGIIFFIKIVKPMMSGGRVGMQNQQMQKYIDDYNRLAQTLQCDPPEVPEYNGYKGLPVLTIRSALGTIVVTAITDYYTQFDGRLLYRNPYTDMSTEQRVQGAAVAQTASAFLDTAASMLGRGSYRSSYRRRHIDRKAEQLTTVKLMMPDSFKGSRILVRPEKLLGKLTNLGEVVISHPGFDKAFKVHGADSARVQALLTPELCDALLRFNNQCGEFQLNEDYLIWVHVGWGTEQVPAVVNALWEVAKVLPR